ncbi:tyrosine-type recombinase/integrase [Streptosporangium sp. CA-135522]|uniref:tyrosine-type recombinase/integrase n=1 Tax=Streptosporangium sp. CA-135522 TaxID=3240072 RepID=UPI003D8DEA1C
MSAAAPSTRQAALPSLDDPQDLISSEFLALVRWDPRIGLVFFPQDHPELGYKRCLVSWCVKAAVSKHQLCWGCTGRWRDSRQELNEFLTASADQPIRVPATGLGTCTVLGCPRPERSSHDKLCFAHEYQRSKRGLTFEAYLAHSETVALPSFGPCRVVACERQSSSRGPYCRGHAATWRRTHAADPQLDEGRWRRTAPSIAVNGQVSLCGLPERVTFEILYGLQERTRHGERTRDDQLRPLVNLLRTIEAASLRDIEEAKLSRQVLNVRNSLLKYVIHSELSPETERVKDVWNAAAFGHSGSLDFTIISQPWLREAMKRWAYDDLPRRRGKSPARSVRTVIKQMALLSDSLRLQRPDLGDDITAVSRLDLTAFLNRLGYLVDQGTLSATSRVNACRQIRRCLDELRGKLSLTRPGEPLCGLPNDFMLNYSDVPDDPEDSEAGKDLPLEVMRQLCELLPSVDEPHGHVIRLGIELLIDTGRRPDEICELDYDCLDRDGDGKPVLIYDNHKSYRKGRRLPITESTAGLVAAQQERVRALFPSTPQDKLKLLPAVQSNRAGLKPVSPKTIDRRHRAWVSSLSPLLVPTTVEVEGERVTKLLPFDKKKIFPYAYRHTYAQRHADAGVPVDVLRELMDHRLLATTQKYYRVGEERRREAVDRVTTLQFDRHGNRIWREAKALLDSEHTRRGVGMIAVPYGGCTEPSNVAAAGHDCPVRYRCVGCGHFRTDVSYLPDLEGYLADLLRSRERLAATFDADEWAKNEALPSDTEIRKVCRLINRIKEEMDQLTEEDKTQIMEAVGTVRRHRQQTVGLGMPRVRPPETDLRPERIA